jgi:thiol-disulfide isomerase/thioredoxin
MHRRRLIVVALIFLSVQSRVIAQTTAPSGPGAALAAQTQQRWISQINNGLPEQVITEIERRLAQQQPAPELPRPDLLYVRARAYLKSPLRTSAQNAQAVKDFVATSIADSRGGELLFRLGAVETDPAQRKKIYQRVIDSYPQTEWAQHSKGAIRRIESIGKPFELDFTDAITGQPVSIQGDFKGKVVILQFWAGWCSDCAAEMPRLKSLYEQYHSKGLEFVGVSLDRPESEGGLRTLKSAVAKFELSWPQYYQGNYFQSEFSSGWGVNAIPWAFILDKQGNLRSAEALPQLEKLIPQLLDQP